MSVNSLCCVTQTLGQPWREECRCLAEKLPETSLKGLTDAVDNLSGPALGTLQDVTSYQKVNHVSMKITVNLVCFHNEARNLNRWPAYCNPKCNLPL